MLNKGDRVRLSAEGIEYLCHPRSRRNPLTRGTVTSFSRRKDLSLVYVLVDGTKRVIGYAASFWEKDE